MPPGCSGEVLGYAPHLDHSDRVKFRAESLIFAFMNLLLWGVFSFSASIPDVVHPRPHRQGAPRGPPHLGNPTGRWFLRLNYYHRVTHFLVFTSFVTLGLTGLPLKYAEYQWAQRLAAAFGGFEVAGALHRMMGSSPSGISGCTWPSWPMSPSAGA